MRVIAGSAGSVPLQVPRRLSRPTTDRVREAVFAALGDLVPGARVLDLFAGSGSLGIEALSRGAATADFVESDSAACAVIAKNLEKTRLAGGTVHRREALAFLGTAPEGRYGLVFADPPYAKGEGEDGETLAALLRNPRLPRALAPGGRLVLESFAPSPLPETPLWEARDERIYGATRISFLAPARP